MIYFPSIKHFPRVKIIPKELNFGKYLLYQNAQVSINQDLNQ